MKKMREREKIGMRKWERGGREEGGGRGRGEGEGGGERGTGWGREGRGGGGGVELRFALSRVE